MEPDSNRGCGFRQGDILPAPLAAKILADCAAFNPEDLAIIITQSCDLLHGAEGEPYVELLIAKRIEEVDGLNLHGRHARRFDFEFGSAAYRVEARHRQFTDRQRYPDGEVADLSLPQDLTDHLRNWIGWRYTRRALPNEFQALIKGKVQDRLRKVAKKAEVQRHVLAIFWKIIPEAPGYSLELRFIASDNALADPGGLGAAVRKHAQQFAAAFASVDLLRCDDWQVLSMRDFTLADLEEFDRWDQVYMSEDSGKGAGCGAQLPPS